MHESPVIDRFAGSADVASCLSAALSQDSPAGFGHEEGSPSLDAKLRHHDAPGAAPKWFEVSRWTSETPKAWNTYVQQPEILVALCLRQSILTLSAGGSPFHDGVIDRGAILVIPPGIELSGAFQTPTDFLHVHVPSRWLTEWLDDEDVSATSSNLVAGPLHVRDSVVIKLTGTLLRALHGRASTSSMYADGIVLSMLARLLEIIVARASAKPARIPSVSPLEAWRVKIAIEFIDQRIDRSLSLAELGAAVGLSPMHFAARFRAATGISPHTFILRRRIEHAQTLLATTRSTVADIAFSVGFRTQAHFTTVFRHHVDDTPHRWRAKHGASQMTTAHGLRR
ncbi:helix-turn-helix domain-containing protein [Paraburkholderia sp. BCC1884]|uniref:helix-turn-helix domain-containing protein n=1 Tax=Paraburkholderia sp. BCC1884 TaxID=2562668 RepID=UPI001642EA7B|nr:AraC family transcriptional regulator [Paraburkholderia sp. BCC1884]